MYEKQLYRFYRIWHLKLFHKYHTNICFCFWIFCADSKKILYTVNLWIKKNLALCVQLESPDLLCEVSKVHIFWEGHKILRKCSPYFCQSKVSRGKFCGLLRIWTLLLSSVQLDFLTYVLWAFCWCIIQLWSKQCNGPNGKCMNGKTHMFWFLW